MKIKKVCFDFWFSEIKVIYEQLLGVIVKVGVGWFIGLYMVVVGDEKFVGDQIVIVIGVCLYWLDFLGSELIYDFIDVLFLDQLLVIMMIIGGGYVVMELVILLVVVGSQVILLICGDWVLKNFVQGNVWWLVKEMMGWGICFVFNISFVEFKL